MLVLSRQATESITLKFGDLTLATITVCGLDRKRVRLGFDADAAIRVHRTELIETSVRKQSVGLIEAASL